MYITALFEFVRLFIFILQNVGVHEWVEAKIYKCRRAEPEPGWPPPRGRSQTSSSDELGRRDALALVELVANLAGARRKLTRAREILARGVVLARARVGVRLGVWLGARLGRGVLRGVTVGVRAARTCPSARQAWPRRNQALALWASSAVARSHAAMALMGCERRSWQAARLSRQPSRAWSAGRTGEVASEVASGVQQAERVVSAKRRGKRGLVRREAGWSGLGFPGGRVGSRAARGVGIAGVGELRSRCGRAAPPRRRRPRSPR